MKFKKGMLLKRLACGGLYKIENISENYYKLRLINCKGELKMINTYSKNFYLLCTSKIIEKTKTGRRYKIVNNSVRRLN